MVCSFEVPFSGNYTIFNLGIRRVYNEGSGTELKLFGPGKELVSSLSGRTRTWNYDVQSYQLNHLAQGDLIYFAVDNVDGFAYDAVEISWSIRFDGPGTGYNNADGRQDIKIYPNPSNGLVHLTLERESMNMGLTLYIKDITGRQMDAVNLERHNLTLNLSHYPAGIYFLQYGEVSKRFIIG